MSSANPPDTGLRLRSEERTVTAADVEAFARLTGDLHPIHLDEEWAQESGMFEERIAPGMLVLSFSIGLVEFDYGRVLALRRLRNVVFKRPTRFGDKIHVDAAVIDGRELTPEIALVTLRWIVRNSEEQTLLRASIEVLWSTRPDP
ncbi:MAG: MaoC family dehydratase [Solirubrobacterales bacterium]